MAIESLRESIEAIKGEDFTGEWKTDFYLDPEEKKIYSFLGTGGVPASAYHGIDLCILTVDPGAIASSVFDCLLSIEDKLEALLDEYQGSEWNGSNWKGKWSEFANELPNQLDELRLDIAYYWDAGEWFSPILNDLKIEWSKGKTAEQIIDEQGCDNGADGACDREEAIEWLQGEIDGWTAEDNDED